MLQRILENKLFLRIAKVMYVGVYGTIALVCAVVLLAIIGGIGYGLVTADWDNASSSTDSGECAPGYPDECLDPSADDYDCASGSGNGPEYVDGPITVRGSDTFGLDQDGDGIGCE